MAEKAYKSSKRGITLGKRVGMENFTLMTIFVLSCVHIHLFISGKAMDQSRRSRDNIFFSTENFKGAQFSP